jgi:DNA-binding XRE family transcriptional regulator
MVAGVARGVHASSNPFYSLKDISFTLESGEEDEERIPWRDAFPCSKDAVPGLVLAGQRKKNSMTQTALSAVAGIPQRHISEMENGKRPIGRENAKKLASALGVDYRLFL